MHGVKENFFCCYRHSVQALQRGDYPNALKWMRLGERHLAAAKRFEDLAGQKHRPKRTR